MKLSVSLYRREELHGTSQAKRSFTLNAAPFSFFFSSNPALLSDFTGVEIIKGAHEIE